MPGLDIGNVICSGTGCFQWIIDDFLSTISDNEFSVSSPSFPFSGAAFYISLDVYEGENILKLSLDKYELSSSKVNVKLSMRTGYKGKVESRRGETNDYGVFKVAFWMQWSEMLERRYEIMTNGQLTIFCELRNFDFEDEPSEQQGKSPSEKDVSGENEASESDSDDKATVSDSEIVKKLQKDLKDLFISREDCDVTIKVQDKEFPSHSLILRARSPVFKSMFSHEMVEKLSGIVVIEDCDPETFPDFLNYLYSASVKHISDKNVCQLYTVSDKYQVEELKQACADFMKSNISVGTFCDILTLALRHAERKLIDLSTEFFCANAIEITKSAKWQIFLRENMTAGSELFIKALSRGNGVK